MRVLSPRWEDDDSSSVVEVYFGSQLAYRAEVFNPSVGEVSLVNPGSYRPGNLAGASDTLDFIWIREDSGGSGGFSTTFVFEPDSEGRLVPVTTLENGVLTKDRWIQADLTYRYWLTSGAGSPTPGLAGIPTYQGMHWLDPRPVDALTPDNLRELVERIRTAQPSLPPADSIVGPALRGFLNLVYSGRAPDAWRFLDECFDAGLARFLESDAVADLPRSREAFRGALLEKMRESPFHAQLLRFNGGSISPPER
ncbi:MAG: hypothetical protein RIT24_207 [Planctomycetota bacterium]